jgi:fructose-specific phosphotransferase system component IIB
MARPTGTDEMTSKTTTQNPAAGLLEILEDLASLLENARAVPLSTNVKVDRDQALGLVDELRDALPTQVARADVVLADAERALTDAHRQAEEIVATARARAIELVDHEQVVVQARSRAAEIMAGAERKAAELRADADQYCDSRLADFDQDLAALTKQVQAGRARLAERLDAGTPRVRWDSVRDPRWPGKPDRPA